MKYDESQTIKFSKAWRIIHNVLFWDTPTRVIDTRVITNNSHRRCLFQFQNARKMHASLVDGRNRTAGAPSASNITQTCSARTLTLRHAFRYRDGVPFVL